MKNQNSKIEAWVEEKHSDFLSMKYRIKNTLFSGVSEFQSVDVVDTKGFGKMLLNDGLVMTCERDEFIYHEMIAHVPGFVHPNPKSVLVIGGGDGGTAREALRHPGVERVKMVEIDAMVVNACKEHIHVTSKDLDHPKLDLEIADAVQFVAQTEETYDLILVDSTDPIGPAQPLFGLDFYRNVHRCLNDGGIVVSQGESPFYETEMQGTLMKILGELFPIVNIYNFSNLTYPGGLWSFTFASKGPHPINDFDPQRVEASGLEFSYYNAEVHRAAFCHPQFMKNNLKGLIKS